MNARIATGLEQARHRLKVFRPVFTAHGFYHFNRANGIERLVLRCFADVSVVLQAQVSLISHPFTRHTGLRPCELLGTQCHAHHAGLELFCGLFSQRTPAATNLQYAVAGFDACGKQGAPHFGVLRLFHRGVRACKNGRRIVHRAIEPKLIKRIAKVVMRVDVFLAVGFGIAVEQVLDAVGYTP